MKSYIQLVSKIMKLLPETLLQLQTFKEAAEYVRGEWTSQYKSTYEFYYKFESGS